MTCLFLLFLCVEPQVKCSSRLPFYVRTRRHNGSSFVVFRLGSGEDNQTSNRHWLVCCLFLKAQKILAKKAKASWAVWRAAAASALLLLDEKRAFLRALVIHRPTFTVSLCVDGSADATEDKDVKGEKENRMGLGEEVEGSRSQSEDFGVPRRRNRQHIHPLNWRTIHTPGEKKTV